MNLAALDLIAAEFVLGTLTGPARRRFERMLEESVEARRAVAGWAERLEPLHEAVSPVEPSPEVWARIVARLGLTPPPLSLAHRLCNSVALWRAVALAAAAAALLLAILRPSPPAPLVAVLQDQTSHPVWAVRLEPGAIALERLGGAAPPPGRAFELWLAAPGAPPLSLGLLPAAEGRLTLPPGRALSGDLLVSVEPPAGAPHATPTGPVVLKGALRDL